MRRGVAAAVAVILSGLVGCGDGDGGGSAQKRCEDAYEQGLGNARTSERESWVADCVAELEAAGS